MQKTSRTKPPPQTATPVRPAAHDIELIDELDALLDEIDGCLEENALEVTRTYRQKGGQ